MHDFVTAEVSKDYWGEEEGSKTKSKRWPFARLQLCHSMPVSHEAALCLIFARSKAKESEEWWEESPPQDVT